MIASARAAAEMALASACLAGRDDEAADIHARRAMRLNSDDCEIVVLPGTRLGVRRAEAGKPR